MIVFRSIKTKLTLWYAGIFSIILGVSSAVAYLISISTLLEKLDNSLKLEIIHINESCKKEFQHLNDGSKVASIVWEQIYKYASVAPQFHYIQIFDAKGNAIYRSENLRNYRINYGINPTNEVSFVTSVGPDEEKIRIAIIRNEHIIICLAYPLNQLYESVNGIFFNLLLIVPLAFLVSIVSGWFLANRSLKPVDELTKAAKEISLQNLNKKLPFYNIDNEIGRLASQLNDMISRLQESFMQIQQFSADASHELRTPLTIMRGEIEIALRNQRMSKEMRELLASIYDELIRLSTIVETLMTLIKSDTGRLALSSRTVPLNFLINQVFEKAKVLAATKKINVKLEKNIPLHIKGDQAYLKQLLLNIVDNAIKYTNPEGSVTISSVRENGRAVVTIKDTGIGIPKKDINKVFNRFYRVERDNKTIKNASGTGLGLSIAKWIAEAHGGTIILRSREGRGTTAVIQLPVWDGN